MVTAADRRKQIPRRIRGSARCDRQHGIALILVLWLTILLTVIGGSFAYGMRNEALAARNSLSLAQARALADGAIYRTVFELMRPRTLADLWSADGTIHVWDENGSRIAVRALDESGKIDLNTAPDGLIKSLLQTAGELDADTAGRLVDVIGDWKDVDDEKDIDHCPFSAFRWLKTPDTTERPYMLDPRTNRADPGLTEFESPTRKAVQGRAASGSLNSARPASRSTRMSVSL